MAEETEIERTVTLLEESGFNVLAAEDDAKVWNVFALRFIAQTRRVWKIVRAVLRGYLTGQPINESRPRKGCC